MAGRQMGATEKEGGSHDGKSTVELPKYLPNSFQTQLKSVYPMLAWSQARRMDDVPVQDRRALV